jgi:putative GTP pyrophosphokinase
MSVSIEQSELRLFLTHYEDYAHSVLQPTEKEIRALFDTWSDQSFWAKYVHRSRLPTPSPIQSRRTRIKRPESIVDKILRKSSIFPDGISIESVRRMRDAVAGRIVVYFLSNLPLLDNEIRNNELLEVSKDEPPVAYLSQDILTRLQIKGLERQTKDSGYASIHYIVRLRQSVVPKGDRPYFEIQVRTLAEHLWGEVEHILGYKPGKKTTFAVRKQFQIISAQLTAIDEHFNLLFEELSRFQEEGSYQANDLLNAENLPAVLNDAGVGCAQREIDGLLKLLASRGFDSIGSFQEVASSKHVEIIRNAYRSSVGRSPDNFEVVACLAAIRGRKTESEIIEGIATQIDFLNAWEQIKESLRREEKISGPRSSGHSKKRPTG